MDDKKALVTEVVARGKVLLFDTVYIGMQRRH